MGRYLLAYQGGGMAGGGGTTQQEAMSQWMSWFVSLGESVTDGGMPTGASATVSSDGSVVDGNHSGLAGYSIISANSLSDACDKAKRCPLLASGGSIDVYELVAMGQ